VLESLSGGKPMSVCDVLRLPIPGADRLWVVLHEGLLPNSIYREFAAMCADIALTAERDAWREPDPRSWAAVDVALRHAAGMATDEELVAARDAAGDAARAAARAAACDATWAAAWAAAGAAARAAAGAAARAAAWDAANDQWCELLYALCVERGIA
jgi:hypothetical protein